MACWYKKKRRWRRPTAAGQLHGDKTSPPPTRQPHYRYTVRAVITVRDDRVWTLGRPSMRRHHAMARFRYSTRSFLQPLSPARRDGTGFALVRPRRRRQRRRSIHIIYYYYYCYYNGSVCIPSFSPDPTRVRVTSSSFGGHTLIIPSVMVILHAIQVLFVYIYTIYVCTRMSYCCVWYYCVTHSP